MCLNTACPVQLPRRSVLDPSASEDEYRDWSDDSSEDGQDNTQKVLA